MLNSAKTKKESKLRKIKEYLQIYFNGFSRLRRIFFYPKVAMDFLEKKSEYNFYWEKRIIDKKKFHFSLNMKWWEKLFSQRYRKCRIVINFIEANSTILDMGCGEGLILEFIKKYKNIKKSVGIDISTKAIRELKKRGLEGIVGDITKQEVVKKLPKVDYILMLDIIEHIQYPEKLLFALKQKYNKGIIINIPNTAFYPERLRLLFGRTPAQYLYFPGEHIRFWSVKDFRWTCRLLGYKITKKSSAGGTFLLKNIFPNIFSNSEVYLIK